MAGTVIWGNVRSWRGEKQMTRQMPDSASARSSPPSLLPPVGTSACNAPKSLLNTKVGS